MTIQEVAAAAIEKSADDLIQAALALPEDKRDWKPLDKGRSTLDQLAECAVQNMAAAKIVQAGGYQVNSMAEWKEMLAEWDDLLSTLDTPEKSAAALREGTAVLASAVRAAPNTQLGAGIILPWTTMTMAAFFLEPFWNMSYHEGQINYIGSLL